MGKVANTGQIQKDFGKRADKGVPMARDAASIIHVYSTKTDKALCGTEVNLDTEATSFISNLECTKCYELLKSGKK